MTYEDALKELEKIAAALEDKDTALEDAVKLFEKSLELSKFCFEKLKETDGKIVTRQTVEIFYNFVGAIDRPIWGNELSDDDD